MSAVEQLILECLERSAFDRRNRRLYYMTDRLGYDAEDAQNILEELEFVDMWLCRDMLRHLETSRENTRYSSLRFIK